MQGVRTQEGGVLRISQILGYSSPLPASHFTDGQTEAGGKRALTGSCEQSRAETEADCTGSGTADKGQALLVDRGGHGCLPSWEC